MALDHKWLKEKAEQNENAARELLENHGFSVQKLDKGKKKSKRPDFLVSLGKIPLLICEVKSIFSAGTLKERNGAHISTLDRKLSQPESSEYKWFSWDGGYKKTEDALRDAIIQYETLTSEKPEYKPLPLVVALFPDFFADSFRLMKHSDFPEISGFIRVEVGWERREYLEPMTSEEMKKAIENDPKLKEIPETIKWGLAINKYANLKLPDEFVRVCIVY